MTLSTWLRKNLDILFADKSVSIYSSAGIISDKQFVFKIISFSFLNVTQKNFEVFFTCCSCNFINWASFWKYSFQLRRHFFVFINTFSVKFSCMLHNWHTILYSNDKENTDSVLLTSNKTKNKFLMCKIKLLNKNLLLTFTEILKENTNIAKNKRKKSSKKSA